MIVLLAFFGCQSDGQPTDATPGTSSTTATPTGTDTDDTPSPTEPPPPPPPSGTTPWTTGTALPRESAEVIVVGAGLAGLAAAGDLEIAGAQVVVLEARDRVGGRVHTDRTTFPLPVELCAQWIEGASGDNPIVLLANNGGVSRFTADYDAEVFYDPAGIKIPTRDVDKAWGRMGDQIDTLFDLKATLTDDIDLAQALQDIGWLDGLDPSEINATEGVWWWENDAAYGADKSDLSFQAWWEEGDVAGDYEMFTSGADAMMEKAASYLDVRLEQPVSVIRWSSDGVEVVTPTAVYEADQVIVTVPLGVLQWGGVQFVPTLPSGHTTAIDRLGFGRLAKIILQFDVRFWDTGDQYILFEGEEGRSFEATNLAIFQTVPILSLIAGGSFAEELEAMDEATAVETAMEAIRKAYPDAGDPVVSLVTHQGDDIYQRGSYTYVPVGASLDDLDALAAPVEDVLFFAGEHTNREYYGWMHGAWWSGERAAAEVVAVRGL